MPNELAKASHAALVAGGDGLVIPAIIADAGDHAARRFVGFFTATIRNKNTRKACARAMGDFLACCSSHRLTRTGIQPVNVAAYIGALTGIRSAPTVKQHLAAICMLFDWLTSGGILPFNPAAFCRQ